jgi:hydrophobe/amphiphile efflux-1 (HAE1) family protein
MARFFIDRPIFAWVISIVVMLAGIAAIFRLPLEQYPNIAPPRVSINTTYAGASAKTIEDSVTQVIEQNLKGLDKLQSMSSTSSASGSVNVTLTFESGTNIDVAQMQVQNKVQQSLARLPQAVQSQGVTVLKGGTDFLMLVTLISEDGQASATDISDYISSTLVDIVSRMDGVSEVVSLGAPYAMRVWLDPNKLRHYNLMPSDVNTALTAQNTQVSAGQLGALPAVPGQSLNATITARSKLQTVDEFRNVLLKTTTDGAVVRLGDVARVELGADSYTSRANLNGQPSGGMGVRLADGANALAVAKAIKAKLAEMQPYFPSGVKAVVAYDTTPFVQVSIEEVVITLIEAIALVVVIMYLFMQNLRATLIPAIAVPVVLLGTFGVLSLLGYSINTLTMFAMVLAIGLLVDDAIVVVENVERNMSVHGLAPKEATQRSMGEISGALVGIALVLSAVFIPMAFFGGSTGVIYRQFSVTVVSAMVLSVVVAMTLTPALCASLLKPLPQGQHHTAHRGLAGRFFGGFNRGFDRGNDGYTSSVGRLVKRGGRSLVVYAVVVAAAGLVYTRLPTSFLPNEDQGSLMAMVQLPAGTTAERTRQVLDQVEDYITKHPDVKAAISITGLQGDQASGNLFISLKDWSERKGSAHGAEALATSMTRDLAGIRDARVFVMLPPAIRSLGSSAGFTVELQDVGGIGQEKLAEAREKFLELARKHPSLAQVRASGLDPTPQFQLAIDDRRAGAMGVSTSDINSTLATALGGTYVNDFLNKGRVKKVYVQGDAQFRMLPEQIGDWSVRNGSGAMVALSSFTSTQWTYGAPRLERYNGLSSYEMVGAPAPGVSSGTAMAAVEEIVRQLPEGVGFSWAAQSYQERLSGSQAPLLYAVSVLFVFLCLAALYESWSVPFSVMLVVPLGIFGAVVATWLAGQSNDVYFQVGLLTTVGLSAKNAILIVEFAQALQAQGMGLIEATVRAAQQRLRPIVMTSLAFAFGVLPLALSTGAGSGGRRAIGTGVLGGVLAATVLGLFLVPVFYVVVRSLFRSKQQPATGATPALATEV